MKYWILILSSLAAGFATAQNIGPEDRVMSIYFGGGSYYIDDQQLSDLEDFINEIEDFREYEVELHGHTDNIGSVQYNQYLSVMRCESVHFEILRLKIDPQIITTHDFGELSPLYDNGSWNGKLHNRRVDVVLKKILL